MPQVEVPAGIDQQSLNRLLERLVAATHEEHQVAVAQWRRVSSIQRTLVLLCRASGVDPGELQPEKTDERIEQLEADGDELREFLRNVRGPTTKHGRWRGTWGSD